MNGIAKLPTKTETNRIIAAIKNAGIPESRISAVKHEGLYQISVEDLTKSEFSEILEKAFEILDRLEQPNEGYDRANQYFILLYYLWELQSFLDKNKLADWFVYRYPDGHAAWESVEKISQVRHELKEMFKEE